MARKIFAIEDVKSGTFHSPFCEASAAQALRGFSIAVNDGGKSMIAQFPGEFRLVELADFHEDSGQLVPHARGVVLGFGTDVLRKSGAPAEVSPLR